MTACAGAPKAILFTQQSIGLGRRKTSMIFLAEAFRRLGFDTGVVTVQLSWLTAIRHASRLRAVPPDRRNRWVDSDGMRGFVWVPPLHPVRLARPWLNRLTAPFARAYGWLLPRRLRREVRGASLIVVESCAAVALLPRLRRLNPAAMLIYSMSDRLDVVGMHPALSGILQREAGRLDLIRTPALAMAGDFTGARVAHIPHGLDKAVFGAAATSPYQGGINAVLGGDMLLDRPVLAALADAFPQVTFHCFGSLPPLAGGPRANVRLHGEVPFTVVAAHNLHADVGLALYELRPGAEYLAQSSLKNLQYRHCGLPVVTPAPVAAELPRAFPYVPGDRDDAVTALRAALAGGPGAPLAHDAPPVRDWDAVAREMLARAMPGLVARGGDPGRITALAGAPDRA